PRLWLDRAGADDGTGAQWQRVLREETAPLTDPQWVGDSLVFTSDRAASLPHHAEQQANLWIIDGLATSEGFEPRRLTDQGEAEGYVRDATTDGTRIVWHSHGELKVLDSLDAQVRTLEVRSEERRVGKEWRERWARDQ